MKFSIVEKEPYVYTFEDREHLHLSIEYIGPSEVEVTGPEDSIAQWVSRTNSVVISDQEFADLVKARDEASAAAEELDYDVQRAFGQAKAEDIERTRALNAQGPLAQSS